MHFHNNYKLISPCPLLFLHVFIYFAAELVTVKRSARHCHPAINRGRVGQTATNHPTCTTTAYNNGEGNITSYCFYIFRTILKMRYQLYIADVDILSWKNTPPAGRFKKSAGLFFSWIKTIYWTHTLLIIYC